jgi:hypothetical protein
MIAAGAILSCLQAAGAADAAAGEAPVRDVAGNPADRVLHLDVPRIGDLPAEELLVGGSAARRQIMTVASQIHLESIRSPVLQ